MLKKGKQVEIICGKDKGKKGEIIEIIKKIIEIIKKVIENHREINEIIKKDNRNH